MHVFIFLYTVPDTPILNDISCTSQDTTLITALAGGLSNLSFLLIAVIATAIVCICVRSKKKPEREADVYYDTINTGQPPIIETELNVAYHHPKKLK